MDPARVSLMRWLRRQPRQPLPGREHLEAAVANDDPVEARRVLADARRSPRRSSGTSTRCSIGGIVRRLVD
jgi:hypothetical protein